MVIELKNIQSIEHAVYNFPDTGIVQITGGNSNGKSILFKALGAVVTLSMTGKTKRRSLIRLGYDSGEISMAYKDRALVVHLHEDRNKCTVFFKRGDEPIVSRTFRDGGIDELVRAFGFYCYGKNQVCLQMYETFGPMPFVNISDEINGEIVESVTEDLVARKFLENYKTVTHPKAVEQKKLLDKRIEVQMQLKENLVLYDWRKYEEFHKKLSNYYNVMKFARVIQLEHVNVPPEIELISLEPISLEHVNVLPDIEYIDIEVVRLEKPRVVYEPEDCVIENPAQLIYEMSQLLAGICPTCGRPLVDTAEKGGVVA